ncbi:MAG: AAA family ATPase [Xanthomonadales bacterium]|nr:AAA family ATPase [Xanthomonadales bacterium]
MTEKPHKLISFFREVWRRHVFQVAAPYCLGGWFLIEVFEVVLGAFEAPNWVLRAILIVFLLGLPIVIALAWIFDFTAAGLVRTSAAPKDQEQEQAVVPAPAMGLSLGGSERRQVTMLSCAFNFRTHQDTEDDPEFLRDAIMALEGVFKDIAARYNGHRLRSTAEGLTLVFGYPAARDDDTRRAVAAGLALLDSAQRLDENHDGIPDLAVHVGIHTGLVVIDESQKNPEGITIIGQVPRFVSWLQAIAPAGAVTISAQTRELVSRYYATESLGTQKQAQRGDAIELFKVTGSAVLVNPAHGQQQVGREQELAQLQARWQHAADGDGQFVLIKGEPGIGKSSLVRAFQQGVSDSAAAWVLPVYCSAYEQNTALYPMAQAMRGPVLGFAAGDNKDVKWRKLQTFVERHCRGFDLALPLLAKLLSSPLPNDIAALTGSPQLIRTQTLELLMHIIRQQAQSRPFLLIIEDLLWADPTTLEWVQMLIEEGPSHGVFLLLTARSSFSADWTRRSYVLGMDLLPLASRSAAELLRQSAGGIELPQVLIDHIVRETGGNPLYVHELTRAVLETDDWKHIPAGASFSDLSWMKIPPTLKDSLAARVDHLGPAKALLQLCSVLGREFDYAQLRAVSGTENEAALKQELNRIVQSELLFKRGSSSNPGFTFKHMLIQETAYNSLLLSKRKELHLRTARIIESEYPDIAQTRPAMLAWHFGEGGEADKAIALWTQAARMSLQSFANFEAITQAQKGLEIVAALPASAARVGLEIPLQSMLGMGLLATRGYAAPEVRQAFTRAQELCEQVGDAPQLFQVVVGLWMYYQISANYARALELSHSLVRIADSSAEPGKFLQSRYCLGYTLYFRAEFQDARKHLEDAMASEQEGVDYAAQSASGDDTRSHIRVWLAHLNWHLGQPGKALGYMDEALKLAKIEGHPFAIAFATFNAAWFHVIRRDAGSALPLARSAVEMATVNGYAFFKPLAELMLAWAEGRERKSRLAPTDVGVIEQLQAHSQDYSKAGARLGFSFHRFLIAEDMIALSQVDEAEVLLQSAWEHAEQTGEAFLAPEYYRLLGKLKLNRGAPIADSVASFRQAVATAQRCESAALHRRAAIDLARALGECDQVEEAIRVLDTALGLITEKDDSGDAWQAEQVLKALRKKPTRKTSEKTNEKN